MTENNIVPVTSPNSDGTNWTLIGGIAALVAIVSVGGYLLFRKDSSDDKSKKPTDKPEAQNDTKGSGSGGSASATTTNTNTTAPPASVANPIRTGIGDDSYYFQKRDGGWYAAKKSAPNDWVSINDPRMATSTIAKMVIATIKTQLDSQYPNG